MSANNSADFARLTRFYAKYAPEKSAADVQATLDKFSSDELRAKMWNGLVKKYGPEPPAAPVVAAAANEHPDFPRLRRFYAKYAPDKTEADVKATLDKFGGSDELRAKMWNGLVKKYGPEPPAADNAAAAAPPLPPPAAAASSAAPGANYTSADVDRLTRFYGKYAPEKTAADVKATLDKFGVSQEQLNKMWNGLVKKYGPEPEAPTVAAAAASAAPPTKAFPGVTSQYDFDRLARFYKQYAPDKTDADIMATLNKFGVSQEQLNKMWNGLVKKYGPEPSAVDAAGQPDAAPASGNRSHRSTPPPQPVPAAAGSPPPSSPASQTLPTVPAPQVAPSSSNSLEEVIKKRLRRLFLKYEPSLAGEEDVDEMYRRYEHAQGGHKAMFMEMRTRYGPEPAADEYLPGENNNNNLEMSRASTAASSSANVHRPARYLPSVKPPASLIDESMAQQRRLEAVQRAEMEKVGRLVCSRMSVRLFGAEYYLYEHASMEAQKKFRSAIEIDVGLHLRIAPKFIRVVGVSHGSIVADIDVDIAEDEQLVAAANNPRLSRYDQTMIQEQRKTEAELKKSSMKLLLDELADAILCGRFRLTNVRNSYRDDLGGNPVSVYAQSIVLDGVNVADFKREQQSQSSRFPGSSLVVSLNPSAAAAQQRALLLAQFGNNPNDPLYKDELEKLLLLQQQQQQSNVQFGIPGGLATTVEASPPRSDEVVVLGQTMLRGMGLGNGGGEPMLLGTGDLSAIHVANTTTNATTAMMGLDSAILSAANDVEHSHFGLMAGEPNPIAALNATTMHGSNNTNAAVPNNRPQAPNFLEQVWFDPNTNGGNAQHQRQQQAAAAAAAASAGANGGGALTRTASGGLIPSNPSGIPSRYDFHATTANENAYGIGSINAHSTALAANHMNTSQLSGGGGGGGGGGVDSAASTVRDRHIDNLMAAIHGSDSAGGAPGSNTNGAQHQQQFHQSGLPVSPEGNVYGFPNSGGGGGAERTSSSSGGRGLFSDPNKTTFTLEELQRLPPDQLVRMIQNTVAPPPPPPPMGGVGLVGGGALPAMTSDTVVDHHIQHHQQPPMLSPAAVAVQRTLSAGVGSNNGGGGGVYSTSSGIVGGGAVGSVFGGGGAGDNHHPSHGGGGGGVRGSSITAGVQTSRPPSPPAAAGHYNTNASSHYGPHYGGGGREPSQSLIPPQFLELQQQQQEQQLQLQTRNNEFIQQQSAQQTAILEAIAAMQKQQQELQILHQRQREEQAAELQRQQKAQEAQLQLQMQQQQQQFQVYQQQLQQYQQYQQQMLVASQAQNVAALGAANSKAEALQGELHRSRVDQRLLHQQYQSAYTDSYSPTNRTDMMPATGEDTRRHALPDNSYQSSVATMGRAYSSGGGVGGYPAADQSASNNMAAAQQQQQQQRAMGVGAMQKTGTMLVPPSMHGFQFR